jgi:AcrR family transcriptional regulator
MRRPSTKSATPAQVTRDELLRATVRVVAEEGLPRLTLDAVARAAGVSKGGLLYHFPTKEALIRALIETFIAEWDRAMAREYARDPEPEKPGRWLRAYVRASFAEVDPNESLTLGLGQGDLGRDPWKPCPGADVDPAPGLSLDFIPGSQQAQAPQRVPQVFLPKIDGIGDAGEVLGAVSGHHQGIELLQLLLLRLRRLPAQIHQPA